MYQHIIKLSSTTAIKAASPRIRKFSSTEAAVARPISVVMYPKNNNKVVKGISAVLYPKKNNNKVVVVKGVMEEDQKSLIDEESKKPAAEGPPLEISLRPFQLTDVDDIMAWGTDEELSRYCRWETYKPKEAYCGWETIKPKPRLFGGFPVETYRYYGWDLETYRSKEDALEDIKNNIIPHPWYRAICLKNNRPIGKIFIDPCSRNNPYMAELGFVVASEHWGKGIATTAVKMVLDTIFKEWPHLRRLQGQVHVENLGAQRVLEKAGFLYEGVLTQGYLDKEGRNIDITPFSFVSTDLFNKEKRNIDLLPIFSFLPTDFKNRISRGSSRLDVS